MGRSRDSTSWISISSEARTAEWHLENSRARALHLNSVRNRLRPMLQRFRTWAGMVQMNETSATVPPSAPARELTCAGGFGRKSSMMASIVLAALALIVWIFFPIRNHTEAED